MTNDFYLYRHAWISAPYFDCQLTDNQCKELLKKGGWMVRNTFDINCNTPTDFWYIIKDSYNGMEELSSKNRKKVQKALDRIEYRIVDKQFIENHGYDVVKIVSDSYAIREMRMNKRVFQDLLANWNEEDCDFWGVFDKIDDKFIGVKVVRRFDVGCFYDMTWILPEYKHNNSYVFYGMYYKLNEYYLGEKHYKYVTDGSRSVTEHSNIQPFLEQNFKFRKAYCKLQIKYKWWFGIIVRLLLPFRKIIKNRNVRAVLNMHLMQS